VALYDAQINYWDDSFREFIERLDGRDWLENAVVVIVADHGDEFYDHGGFGHGFTLYTEMIHIPMYFISEGRLASGVVRDDLVRLIDVAPTLYGLSGMETAGMNLEGVDLFGFRDRRADADRSVYSETYLGGKPRSIRTADQQLVFNSTRETWELYDLSRDPAEKNDLYPGNETEFGGLAERLSELMKDPDLELQSSSVELDERTIQELRELGYLE
jgi:arylsulfatase A-like enzyme